MEFNKIWTKKINDRYRQMIKEKKSILEIKKEFKDYIDYHPNKKFGSDNVFSWELFKEIKFNPNYVYFTYQQVPSLHYSKNEYKNNNYQNPLRKEKTTDDYICFFKVKNIEYIIKLEYFSDHQFNIIYHVSFTTKIQYDLFIQEFINIISTRNITNQDFNYLKNIYEEETNLGDIITLFNSIFYIILEMYKRIPNCIYMIAETDRLEKIHYYKQSIEDSFKQFTRIEGYSPFFPNQKVYYYK